MRTTVISEIVGYLDECFQLTDDARSEILNLTQDIANGRFDRQDICKISKSFIEPKNLSEAERSLYFDSATRAGIDFPIHFERKGSDGTIMIVGQDPLRWSFN